MGYEWYNICYGWEGMWQEGSDMKIFDRAGKLVPLAFFSDIMGLMAMGIIAWTTNDMIDWKWTTIALVVLGFPAIMLEKESHSKWIEFVLLALIAIFLGLEVYAMAFFLMILFAAFNGLQIGIVILEIVLQIIDWVYWILDWLKTIVEWILNHVIDIASAIANWKNGSD